MGKEERCAFVQAQAACAMAEIAAMQIQNQMDVVAGRTPQFQYHDFMEIQNNYMIGHNTVIDYLREG